MATVAHYTKIKSLLLLFCSLLIGGTAVAQVAIKGNVNSFTDKKGIPYVSIGIQNTSVGTTTNEDGSFSILIPAKYQSDTLVFSALGYGKKAVFIACIAEPSMVTLFLSEKETTLDTVTILAKKEKKQQFELGNKYLRNGMNLCSNPLASTGAAVALLISYKYPSYHKDLVFPLYLKEAKVKIAGNTMGDFKVRVRLLAVDSATNSPGQDILHESVIASSTIKNGWLKFDLIEHKLIIDKDFYISFEWIYDLEDRVLISEAYREFEKLNPDQVTSVTSVVNGEEVALPYYNNFLSGVAFGVSLEPFSTNNYTGYFRYNSMGKWEPATAVLAARVTLSN